MCLLAICTYGKRRINFFAICKVRVSLDVPWEFFRLQIRIIVTTELSTIYDASMHRWSFLRASSLGCCRDILGAWALLVEHVPWLHSTFHQLKELDVLFTHLSWYMRCKPLGVPAQGGDQGRHWLAKLVWNVHLPRHLWALNALKIWVMGTGVGYVVLSAFLYVLNTPGQSWSLLIWEHVGQMPCVVKQPTVFWSLAGRKAGQN